MTTQGFGPVFRRRYLRLAAKFATFAGLVVGAILAAYWTGIVITGTHTYHGLPSAYWAHLLQHQQPERKELPALCQATLAYLGLNGAPSMLRGDRTAMAVLLELVDAPEASVRLSALDGLGFICLRSRKLFEDNVLVGDNHLSPLAAIIFPHRSARRC